MTQAQSKIIWTALPNGRQNGRLNLSAYLSLRLTGATTLGRFPDFLNWPATLKQNGNNNLNVQLRSTNGQVVQIPASMINTDELDEGLWGKIFNSETLVKPFGFEDLGSRFWLTYSVRNTVSRIKTLYQTIAVQSPTDPPHYKHPSLDSHFKALAPILNKELLKQVKDLLEKTQLDERTFLKILEARVLAGNDVDLFKRATRDLLIEEQEIITGAGLFKLSQQTLDFYRAHRFYKRGLILDKGRPTPPDNPPFDFHEVIGLFGDHPYLLRKLGLILDLGIPAGDIQDADAIRIIPQWQNDSGTSPTENISPWTAIDVDFLPKAKEGLISNSMLDLSGTDDSLTGNGDFDLVQIDPDGAILKNIGFAGGMDELMDKYEKNQAAYTTSEEITLPSLRSGGLALVANERLEKLLSDLRNAKENNDDLISPDKITLYAEDLLRGFRVDVWDESQKKWFSLSQRKVDYKIGAADQSIKLSHKDEGYIKSASAAGSVEENNKELYLHETLFAWDGWSLVARRPGLTILNDESQPPNEIRNEANKEYGVEAEPQVLPGSLPRLRFGRNYRMRVRTVDLAGNSNSLDFITDGGAFSHATEPIIYQRFEPVSPPVIVQSVPKERESPGESLERMVVRSNDSQSAQCYADENQIYGFKPENKRYVFPNSASQLMAETHGMFDSAIGSAEGDEIGSAFDIAKREENRLPEFIEDRALPNSINYLPDPPARGVSLWRIGNASVNAASGNAQSTEIEGERVLQIAFGGGQQWPDLKPFTIVLTGLPSSSPNSLFKWDNTNRVITICLRQTEILTLRYSTYLNANDANSLGIYSWLAETSRKWEETRRQIKKVVPDEIDKIIDNIHTEEQWKELLAILKHSVESKNDDAKEFDYNQPAETGLDKVTYKAFGTKAKKPHILIAENLTDQGAMEIIARILPDLKNTIFSPYTLDQLTSFVNAGLHWMITPYRELTLVHAVQKPLRAPQFQSPLDVQKDVQERCAGSTNIKFSDNTKAVFDQASTEKMQLIGSWTEYLDNLNSPGPTALEQKAFILEEKFEYKPPVQPGETDTCSLAEKSYSFGDTKYRKVSFTLNATSRFRDYFPPSITQNAENVSKTSNGVTVDIPSTSRPHALKIVDVLPTFKWEVEDKPGKEELKFQTRPAIEMLDDLRAALYKENNAWMRNFEVIALGSALLDEMRKILESELNVDLSLADTKAPKVHGNTIIRWATELVVSIFPSFFTPPEKRVEIKITPKLAPMEMSASSSTYSALTVKEDKLAIKESQALSLQAAYELAVLAGALKPILPPRKIIRTRRGNALRIYLERPWYSSGGGELVSAVFWQSSPTDLSKRFEEMKNKNKDEIDRLSNTYHQIMSYVSMIGRDPIWTGGDPIEALDANAILNGVKTKTLSLPEFDNITHLDMINNNQRNFSVIGISPQYDSMRKLWFCDIEFSKDAIKEAYSPFVNLVLARYQPNSIEHMKLSQTTQTGFVQLLPYRKLTVEHTIKGKLMIRLEGPQPTGPQKNTVRVEVEKRDNTISGDFGWTPLADKQATLTNDGDAWVGEIDFGNVNFDAGIRVAIKEFEYFDADISGLEKTIISVKECAAEVLAIFGIKRVVLDPHREQRMVFADIVEL